MAVDFSALLKKPSGQAKRPKTLAAGRYPGKIKSFEIGDKNKNNTPYIRLHLALIGWPDSVGEEDRMQEGADGQMLPIDLSKRSLSRDLFIKGIDGSDLMYRVDEFLRSLDIELGAPYDELLPQMVNKDVYVDVTQYVNQTSGEMANQVDKVVARQD